MGKDIMSNNTFYFVIYANDKTTVKVVDLASCVDYERSEFPAVNNENIYDRDEAIQYARSLADEHGLKYELFESRYDKDLNESLILSSSSLKMMEKEKDNSYEEYFLPAEAELKDAIIKYKNACDDEGFHFDENIGSLIGDVLHGEIKY